MKLETTTIYTHVAIISERRITSPLDLLASAPAHGAVVAAVAEAPVRPVGRMRIEIEPLADAGSVPAASAVVTLFTDPGPVQLTGIIVREPRAGWVTLELPPVESWRGSKEGDTFIGPTPALAD